MELLAMFDSWSILLIALVALALVATLGYFVGRRSPTTADALADRSRSDLGRARAVARELDESLSAQLALMNRYEIGFSVAIFDIDHFKRVNDEHGHLQGDRVLQKVANLLDELARETDCVARCGDEFLVVMPRTDLEGVCLFAERVRAAVEIDLSVTVSGGVTAAMDGDTPDSLLSRADAALHQAKTNGRNCVCRHDGALVEPVAEVASVPHLA